MSDTNVPTTDPTDIEDAPLDFKLMLIGALGSLDERISTIETQLAMLVELGPTVTKLSNMADVVTEAIEGMQNHPMLKMFGPKKG